MKIKDIDTVPVWMHKLTGVMEKLRSDDGCPWDREQTHQSIKKNLIEEAYEVLEAIENEDMSSLKEELGDLLLQIVFHSHLAQENGSFTFQNVLEAIHDKLIRRHPHVFGDGDADNAEDALKNWEKIKKTEKKDQSSIFDGIPKNLPALQLAQKIQSKASKIGFDWDSYEGAFGKLMEEMNELKSAHQSGIKEDIEEEFGDVLFSLVNLSRFMHLHAEDSLRMSIKKFKNRFQLIEKHCNENSLDLHQLGIDDLEKLWEDAKKFTE